MSEDALRELIRQALREALGPPEPASPPTSAAPVSEPASAPGERGPAHRPLPLPLSSEALERMKRATPARIITGRVGTRYRTESYLGLRADHAIALDAVESEVPEGWAAAQGWIPLRTRAKDHAEFFLHPDLGRRLDEASRATLEKSAERSVDIQLIGGDGLSAVALQENGPPLMQALQRSLSQGGFRLGPPLFVKYARIGVQDEIGVITGARATVILVGERPGLGTGDSLSIYTAFAPRLGQDNSEKDCISNVRSLGFVPERAAVRCSELMQRTFAAGGGGVKLVGRA